MNKFRMFGMLILGLMTASFLCAQQPAGNSEPARLDEFQRAIFVDSLGPELFSKARAEKAIQTIRDAQFNTIFLHARYQGQVFYNSSLEPRSERIDPSLADPLRDYSLMVYPLNDNVKPIQIFAWFSLFPAYSGVISSAPPQGNILQRRPEWLMFNHQKERMDKNSLYYIDPGIPAVQEYILAMLTEFVKNYNPAGILLDDFRYPDDGLNWGYNPQALMVYFKETQTSDKPLPHDPRWCDWRRAQLTGLLEKIQKQLKPLNPNLQIYVTAVAWGDAPASNEDFRKTPAYSLVLQDWATWLNKGLVDGVVLENYKQAPQQSKEFDNWLDFAAANRNQTKVICGIGGFFNFTNTVINQIRNARHKDMNGVALYCYRAPSQDGGSLLFAGLPQGAFADKMTEFRRSVRHMETPQPTPQPSDSETSPPLSLAQTGETTATLAVLITPTPTPPPIMIPSLPGLPSLPDLAKLTTPTPIFVAPEPEEAPQETTVPVAPILTPAPSVKTPAPALTPAPAQTPAASRWDMIYLKNGRQIKGKVIDQLGDKTTIETSQGFVMTIPSNEVEKIEKNQ